MGAFIIGPKIPVIDEQADGSTYGNNMRQFLRMIQALLQANVINLTTANPPANPANGATYIVAAGATGVWTGQENNIAFWTLDNPNAAGGEWDFWPPLKGWMVGNQADGSIYQYNGTEWVKLQTGGGGGGVSGKWPGNWIGSNAAAYLGNDTTQGGNFGMLIEGYGDVAFATVLPTATTPRLQSNPGGITTTCGLIDNAPNITLGLLSDWFTKIALIPSLALRVWLGFSDVTDSTAAAVLFSDTPAANFCGFRFSTDADTTIKAICQTSSSNQTVADTGVAPVSGELYLLEIVPTNSGATVAFYINGLLVATIDTNVPTNSTVMGSVLAADILDNLSSSGSYSFAYIYALLNA